MARTHPSKKAAPKLENLKESNADQGKPSDNGKEEAEPMASMIMGADIIAKRNAVLTQAIVLDLAATKQIQLRTSILDNNQQQSKNPLHEGRVSATYLCTSLAALALGIP